MSPDKQREIARKGGRAAHEKGTAHEWSPEEAREAGRKGGQLSRGGRGKATALVLALLALSPGISAAQTIMTVGPVTPGSRFAWEVVGPATPSAAQALVPRMRIDAALIDLTMVTCRALTPPVANESTCEAPVPDEIRALVNMPGAHTVSLRLFDTVTMVETPDAVPIRVLVPAACVDGARMIAVGGSFGERNQLSTNNQAARVTTLRRAGFRLDVFRAQHKDPSTPTFSDGGYWWILAECVGIPQ